MSQRNRAQRMAKVWEKRGRMPSTPTDHVAWVKVGTPEKWKYVPMSARFVRAHIAEQMKEIEKIKKEEQAKAEAKPESNDTTTPGI